MRRGAKGYTPRRRVKRNRYRPPVRPPYRVQMPPQRPCAPSRIDREYRPCIR